MLHESHKELSLFSGENESQKSAETGTTSEGEKDVCHIHQKSE